jgi:hypothetical protein
VFPASVPGFSLPPLLLLHAATTVRRARVAILELMCLSSESFE